MTNQNKKIVAVVSDLIFSVKIQETAKRAGASVLFAKTAEQALDEAKQCPAAIILDLNNGSVDALDLITKLKSDSRTTGVDLLGYVSHVQTDLKLAAQERGCDVVMARSAFSQNLPAILRRYVQSGAAAD